MLGPVTRRIFPASVPESSQSFGMKAVPD
jgi:hypothetical protein